LRTIINYATFIGTYIMKIEKNGKNSQNFRDTKLPRQEAEETFDLTELENKVRIWKPVLR